MSVSININEINNTCNDINRVYNSMKIELDNISNLVYKFGTAWTGSGAAAFMEKYKELSKCFDDVTNELNKVNLFYKLKVDGFSKANDVINNTYGG